MGSRRQAVRRRFESISSRLLHSTILDFRLRLVLLAALTLPFILMGGLVHALASGHPWTTSAYLVYGLLFRVPALGAVRLDEPPYSAAVLNAVFLFGTFGFAILVGLIGEEVKGTVKALRTGGTPLDLHGHVVLLNFTADATAVALLRQVAEDVGKTGSPLYGRPVVVLAARPLPVGLAAATGGPPPAAGRGSGDLEDYMKRVVADALQGRGSCEWHLRVGSSCRTDDLARVCAAKASYVVLLADPRVATTRDAAAADAAAAGAASCLQAQSLMCLTSSMAAHTAAQQLPQGAYRSTPGAAAGGRPAGGAAAWGATRGGRQQPTIVVQSPADAPQPLPLPGGLGGGPISTFRSVVAAEGSRALVIEVRDRGIVDRLVAQTVLQPGVATVLARLFGSSGGEGAGFLWVEWSGLPPPPSSAAKGDAASARGRAGSAREGASSSGGGGGDVAAAGLRRRRLLVLPRTLSYSTSHRSLGTAEATDTAGGGSRNGSDHSASVGAAAAAGGGGGASLSRSASTDRSTASSLHALTSPYSGNKGARHQGEERRHTSSAAGGTSFKAGAAAAAAAAALAAAAPAAAALGRSRAQPILAGSSTSSSPYGEVREALEAAAAAAAGARTGRRVLGRYPPSGASPRLLPPPLPRGCGSGRQGVVVVGYLSAATGTLRLNPRDTSPVYPGDQLVLLVSEDEEGPAMRSRRGSWGPWGWGGGGAANKAAMTPKAAAAAAAGAAGGELARGADGGDSGRTAAAAKGPPALLPLQGWHSEPLDQGDDRPLVSPTLGSSDAAGPVDRALPAVPESGCPAGGGGGGRSPPPPPRVKYVQRSPAAPPTHIIVISRTAASVREVVTGLQEFAPAGSSIALLTHDPPAPLAADAPVARATPAAAAAANPPAAAAAANPLNAPAAATAAATCLGAVGGTSMGSSTTVVLPCPSSSWPVGDADLVIGGLAHAAAVLVARDSGLQPHEADATALSAVLQLHHTLTDPTRSPLRRWPSPAAATAAATAAVGNLAAAPQPGAATASPGPSAAGGPTAAPQQHQHHHQPHDPHPQQQELTVLPDSPRAPGPGGDAAPMPLHVVVCLHSTRARETLYSFLGGINAQPAFTLEALVPEEYRALLLAGVVRQPQSHAIMTDLLSDRPGAPEVYLVPPARLLAVAAAQRTHGGPQDASCASTATTAATVTTDECRTTAMEQESPPCPAAGTPQPLRLAGLASWRFRDIALAARGCGCTAIGVLRGGGDVDGGGGGLQLAPPPDVPLGLAAGDRLVVLAADPV